MAITVCSMTHNNEPVTDPNQHPDVFKGEEGSQINLHGAIWTMTKGKWVKQ